MKKAIATALCMLLVPAMAMAMQPVSEEELDTVTGQSGVSIVIDDVQIYQHMDGQETWYEDTSDDGASLGVTYDDDESYTMMYVNAIGPGDDGDEEPDGGSFGETGIKGTYKSDYSSEFEGFSASPLTIDVTDNLDNSSEIEDNGDVAGVKIGLPTVEIHYAEGSSDIMNIAVSTAENPIGSLDDNGNAWSFGKIHQTPGDSTMAVLDGNVEVSPKEAWD